MINFDDLYGLFKREQVAMFNILRLNILKQTCLSMPSVRTHVSETHWFNQWLKYLFYQYP